MKENYENYLASRKESVIKGLFIKVALHINTTWIFHSGIRNKIYRWLGVNLALNDRGIFIAREVLIDDNFPELVTIDEGAVISWRVILICHDALKENDRYVGGIHIHRKAVVGAGSIVLPGVNIGEYAVVGAGSVVVKDVAPYTIVAGSPARVIKSFTP